MRTLFNLLKGAKKLFNKSFVYYYVLNIMI